MKNIKLTDILTHDELVKAVALYNTCDAPEFNRRLATEIIAPAMPRINQSTGQENDARYLAYAIEYAFNQRSGGTDA